MTNDEILRGIKARRIDPSRDLHWFYPEEAIHKVTALADFLGLDTDRDRGRPLPNTHRLEILGRLVRAIFLAGPEEEMATRYGQLQKSDQEYLSHLIVASLAALRSRLDRQPTIPLGLPIDRLGTWTNLLDCSWLPMPAEWRVSPRR